MHMALISVVVVHLDSDVRPTAAFKVPFNVTCLTADGNVIYAGTDAESVYGETLFSLKPFFAMLFSMSF